MTNREEIEKAIQTIQQNQAVLGSDVAETAVFALRRQLTSPHLNRQPHQRKQVTILFADISGFTAMAEAVDAEDVNNVMNALWEQLDRAIIGHGGHIDKHMGDGVMAMWGAETAREDDPEQAIWAALEMQQKIQDWRQAVQEFPLLDRKPADISIRIGVHTGPVLLGYLGTTGEYTAIGDTVNVASRLEENAPPGGILISQGTYQHVRGRFDVRSLGSMVLKGKADPVVAYRVQQARPRAFRLETRGIEGVSTRMIGRDAEFSALQNAWQEMMAERERRMMTIVGEAGMGKSRLLHEFGRWIRERQTATRFFRGRASEETQHIPYALLRNLFLFHFQIQESERPEIVRHKVEEGFAQVFGQGAESVMRAHFIGRLLGFEIGESPHLAARSGDAQQRRDRALSYLQAYFKQVSQLQPVILVLEDVHWADEASLHVIEHLAQTIVDQPLLIICLARPSLWRRWPLWEEERPFHTQITLNPLSAADSELLVEEVLQKVERVPRRLRRLIVYKAEGNPFFVEELVRMLIEEGVILKEETAWRIATERLSDLHIPPTLTGLLQARLDRLPALQRAVLQQAAVIGRSFWKTALAHIWRTEGNHAADGAVQDLAALADAIETLCRRELIFQRTSSVFSGTSEYAFKHVILRDVAYESVLKEQRRAYHSQVAAWLERQDSAPEVYTGLIADHLALAGEAERAIRYLAQAGEQAAARFAQAEAVAYFSRALRLIPDSDRNGRYRIHLAREQIYHLQGKRQAQARDLSALSRLARDLGDLEKRAEVALRRGNYALAIGDYPAAITVAQEAIQLSLQAHNAVREAHGYWQWGQALRYQGEHDAALTQFEKALNLAQTAPLTGMSAPVDLQRVKAYCLQAMGEVATERKAWPAARRRYQAALSLFRQIDDRRGQGQILNHLGILSRRQGDLDTARNYYERSLHINREIGNRQGQGTALGHLGMVAQAQGDEDSAVSYHERALQISRDVGDRRGQAMALNNLGRMAQRGYDFVAAGHRYEQALRIYQEIGDRRGEAEIAFALGQIAHTLAYYEAARARYQQALTLYEEIGQEPGAAWTLVYASVLASQRGNDAAAETAARRALRAASDLANVVLEAEAALALGRALAAAAKWDAAAAAYRRAAEALDWRNDQRAVAEARAGLAQTALAQETGEAALAHAEAVLAYLSDQQTQPDLIDSLRLDWICYQVLRARQDPRADSVLAQAQQKLQQQGERFSSEQVRQAFWERSPLHRRIREAV